MKKKFLLIAFSLAGLLATLDVNASSGWANRVPNGTAYDCSACHTSGSTRNSFGTAFRTAGNRWTAALSALDSDGDGFTNGQELGDPRGVWTSGAAVPIPGAQVSNPGSATSRPTLTPPALNITSPANGASFTAPYVGPIVATPGNAAAINQVQFYAGTTLLGTDTTSPFSLAVNLAAGTYSLTVRAVDYLGASNTSAAVTITVGTTAVAPTITTQPASQAVTAGANVSFTVAATGTAPLNYQWRKGGANIAGATAATLSLTAVTTAAAGTYNALVSNSAGSATSATAILTVNPASVAPVITTQPASQTLIAGANVTFTVAATGTAPLSYQWRKNGANISGATSAALALNGVGVADSGDYTALVSNTAGSATSAAATLTVNPGSTAAAPGDQSAPAMAGNSNVTLVVWQDARSGDSYDIYGTRLSSTGAVLNTILIGTAAGNQVQPKVACNGTDFLVVWADYQGGNAAQIIGARVNASGNVLDPQGFIICVDALGQAQPAVASDGANYLVVWQDFRGPSADIYGARVTSAGVMLDPAGLVISQAAGQEINPTVAGNTFGYLVVWQDDRSGSGYDIYGTRVNSAGVVTSPNGIVINAAAFDQLNPMAGGNGTNFLVLWQDFRNGSSFDIYSTVITSAGAVSSPNGIAVCAAAGDQFNPVLASAGTSYLAVWTDIRNGANFVIYGARISSAGSITDPNGIVISTSSGEHYHPAVERNGTGWWTAWQDYRNGDSSDLYGSRVASAGTVSDVNGVLLTPAVVVSPPQTPVITWAAPASITYGTALSGSQLRATANVPGTFQYSPAAGTVLTAGARTLTVVFTPTDTQSYTTATATVPLTVNRAALTIRADNKTKVAGQPNPTLTATYTGFVNGDTAARLTTPVTLTTTATTSSPAGTYPIVPSGATSPNYTITFVNGTLTVTGAPTSGTRSFTNATSISIRNNASASVYPATINVSGLSGTIAKVTVKLNRLTHKRPDDLDILLVGPSGQKILLMSDAGGPEDLENVTLTFDDAASTAIPDNGKLGTATYRSANYAPADVFPSPAPAGPYATALSAFNGTNPNGSWRLYVVDDAAGEEGGSLARGWSLTLITR